MVFNDDGTLTYSRENDGWAMARSGAQASEETLTVQQAKLRWPQHASKIDEAANAK